MTRCSEIARIDVTGKAAPTTPVIRGESPRTIPMPGRRRQGRLRPADRDGPRPGATPDGRATRSTSSSRTRTRSTPSPAAVRRPRPGRSTPTPEYPSGDRQAILARPPTGRRLGRHGNHAFAWRLPGRHRRGAHGGADLPARPDPVPAPRDRGRRGDPRPRRRDDVRPEPDRDERRLRRAVHRGRVHPVRAALAGPLARPLGVLDRAARRGRAARAGARVEVGRGVCHRRRSACWSSAGARSGAILLDPRARRRHDRAGLHGDERAAGPRRAGNYLFVRADGRPDRWAPSSSPSSARSPGRPRRPASPSSGRPRSGILVFLVAIAAGTAGTDSPSARSPSTPIELALRAHPRLGVVVAGAFTLGHDSGFGPLAPPPAAGRPGRALRARRAGAGRLAPPGRSSACRPSGAWSAWSRSRSSSTSSRTCRGRRRQPGVVDSWPPGNTGPDLLELTQPDVRLPQHAARDPRRVVAVVGVAVRPQAGLVLPGVASRPAPSAAIYDAGNLVTWWLAIPAMAVRAPGRPSSAGASALGLVFVGFAVPVDALGADRPGDVPVPLLHACRSCCSPSAYFVGRALARAPPPHVAAGPRVARRGRAPGPGACCGCSRAPVRVRPASTAVNPGSQACVAATPGRSC